MNKIKKFLNLKSDLMVGIVGLFLVGLVLAIPLYLAYLYIGWTDGNLEYVLSHFKEREIKVPFWISAVVVLFTNVATLLFNIICELIKL